MGRTGSFSLISTPIAYAIRKEPSASTPGGFYFLGVNCSATLLQMTEKENHKSSILACDPGRSGGWCLLSADGQRMMFWQMPLIGGKVTGVGISSVYHEIKTLCKVPPLCFFEKCQAMPHDGKVGMSSYFKGAGLIEMIHLFGWSITLVPPGTWCKFMHAGIDGKMHPKDKSRMYVAQKWPHLYQQGSVLWPGRTKVPHEGLMDALMIAEYARQQVYGQNN